jgi:acyl carrier protein
VGKAVVVVRDVSGALQLVAYVTAREGGAVPGAGELRTQLRERLPEYMVPSTFVLLEALPVTPSGKVDSRALPAPEVTPAARSAQSTANAPRTPSEEAIAAIWREVLQVDHVEVHDDFFEIGGHSLRAMQMISRVRRMFGVEFPLGGLYDAPTVATLAAAVMALRGSVANDDMSASVVPQESRAL